VHRRGRAGQVIDLVDLEEERCGDVVPDNFKGVAAEKMFLYFALSR